MVGDRSETKVKSERSVFVQGTKDAHMNFINKCKYCLDLQINF